MSEVGTNERLLRSDVTLEESRKIERVLRRNNISYFEKWNFHTGVFKFLNNSKNSKCDIYVHILWTRQRNCLQICRIYL